jgi:hypothetical protein
MATTALHTRLRLLAVPALLSITLGMTACSSTPKPAKCDENQGAYINAEDRGHLSMPTDAPATDRRAALVIPSGNGKNVDKTACLQRSPSYFGTAGRIAASPEEMVADWAQAWADRNSAAVVAMYSSSKFTTDAPGGGGSWLAQRGKEVSDGPLPSGRVTNLKIVQQGNDRRVASFIQQFGAASVQKELNLIRDAGLWKISAERVVTAQSK